MKKKTLVA